MGYAATAEFTEVGTGEEEEMGGKLVVLSEIGDGVVPITSALRRSAGTVSVVYAGWWPTCTVLASSKARVIVLIG